jgi:hypothetical protein
MLIKAMGFVSNNIDSDVNFDDKNRVVNNSYGCMINKKDDTKI